MSRPTIKDVARLARVSTATVSNVLNGTRPVKPLLRERVEAAARQLDYQADRAAARLRSGQTRVVGILVPDLDDTFFTSLVSRLEVMAGRDNYDVIVASSRNDPKLEASRIRALLAWRPDGVVAVPCTDVVPASLAGGAARVPVVLADRVVPEGAATDSVTIDNREAGEIAARHLVTMGHRSVLVAASSLDFAPIRERLRGADDYLRMAGNAPEVLELGTSSEDGAQRFARWLERNSRPSAVFALTNVTTLAVLAALAASRIDIPQQVSVIGFDDYAWMSARQTPLTAIRQPVDAMAAAIWERLTARMAGDAAPPQTIRLAASLQVRASVRRIEAPRDDPAPVHDRPQPMPDGLPKKSVH